MSSVRTICQHIEDCVAAVGLRIAPGLMRLELEDTHRSWDGSAQVTPAQIPDVASFDGATYGVIVQVVVSCSYTYDVGAGYVDAHIRAADDAVSVVRRVLCPPPAIAGVAYEIQFQNSPSPREPRPGLLIRDIVFIVTAGA